MTNQGLFGVARAISQLPTASDQNQEPGEAHQPPASEEAHGSGPNPPLGWNEDGKPKPYTGILRKRLPQSDSPEYRREFSRRWFALYEFYGLEPGDTERLLSCLIFRHVPGFRSKPQVFPSEYGKPNRLLLGLIKNRPRRGRPKKTDYDLVLDEAVSNYKSKKRDKPNLSDVEISRLFLRQKINEYDRKFRELLERALEKEGGKLGNEDERYTLLSDIYSTRDNPFAGLSPETLARKISEHLGRRKNADANK